MSNNPRNCLYRFTCFLFLTVFILPTKPVAAPYYEGKILTLIVGSQAGGGYDTMARLIARHLSKHIPGKPAIIVQNMPGASHRIAANYLYGKSKPDGLTIGLLSNGLVFSQLLKVEGILYDSTKFEWIGSSSVDLDVLVIRSDLPYKSSNDLLKATKPIFMAGSGRASPNTYMITFVKEYCKLNMESVNYPGGGEIWLAIERKECDGVWAPYNSVTSQISRGLVRPVLRAGSQIGAYSQLPQSIKNLPLVLDLITDPVGKALMRMLDTNDIAGKGFRAPPGTPANLMNILRDAFAKAIKDPELQADAKNLGMEVIYVSGEECLKAQHYILSQPPEIVKEFKRFVVF